MTDEHKKPDALNRDPELKRLAQNEKFFSANDIQVKTEVSHEQRRDLSIIRGYSKLIGGLPGIDESLDFFELYGASLNRKSRIEWVETMKPGNTVVTPTHYPLPTGQDGKPKTLVQKVLGN